MKSSKLFMYYIVILLVTIFLFPGITTAQSSAPSQDYALLVITLNRPAPISQLLDSLSGTDAVPLMLEGQFRIGSQEISDFYLVSKDVKIRDIPHAYTEARLGYIRDIIFQLEKGNVGIVKNIPEYVDEYHLAEHEYLQSPPEILIKRIQIATLPDTVPSILSAYPDDNVSDWYLIDKEMMNAAIEAKQPISKSILPPKTFTSESSTSTGVSSTWYPNAGTSHTYKSYVPNMRYTTQWFQWDNHSFGSNQTYEHEFILNNYSNNRGTYLDSSRFSTLAWPLEYSCMPIIDYASVNTGWDSLPYLDTRLDESPHWPILSCGDEEVAFTVGFARAEELRNNTPYYIYIRAKQTSTSSDKFKLQAQLGYRIPSVIPGHDCSQTGLWTWCSEPYEDSRVQLVPSWNSTVPGTVEWTAPRSCPDYRVEYFKDSDNKHLHGSPRFVRCESWPINHDWGSGGPSEYVKDHFSARWTGRSHFNGGNYTFIARADDGIRVWIDNQRIIDAWRDQAPTTYRTTRYISGGDHNIKVEYYENGGGAVAQFRWERTSSGGPPNCPGGYAVEYFNNRNLSGGHAYATCEGWPINHDWGGGGPGHGVHNDNFSARWTGRAHIDSGNYTFIARADDGIRVWIDNQRIIDAWQDQAPTTYRSTRYISGGDHNIKVEYYEHGGGAVAQFRWERASSGSGYTYEIIAKHSGKCLDVEGARQNNGANVQQWACGGGMNQRWRLENAGSGYYRIVAVHSGKCLDVTGASQNNGANVIQWDCHGGDNQLWQLEQHGDAYRLKPKHSGKALDVEGARQNNGANVQQWQFGGGPNQLWRLVRH